ncbi:hypothetical protein ACS0PU_004865 [Formica fusca]
MSNAVQLDACICVVCIAAMTVALERGDGQSTIESRYRGGNLRQGRDRGRERILYRWEKRRERGQKERTRGRKRQNEIRSIGGVEGCERSDDTLGERKIKGKRERDRESERRRERERERERKRNTARIAR